MCSQRSSVPNDVDGQLKEAKKQLRDCKRKLKQSQAENERLIKIIGQDELGGWKPQQQVEREYGWVHAWLFPLYSYLNQNVGQQLTPNIRNRVIDIIRAIIAQLVVEGRYGIKLPLSPCEVDVANFMAKQEKILKKEYEPCVICGENRITHECHIIPRSEGGPFHKDNFLTLCPLHHHLFDNNRLLPDEWDKVMAVIETKMEAAIIYAREIRLSQHRKYWVDIGK